MKTQFTPVSNGGQPGDLEALYYLCSWIKELVGTRKVSVIYVMSADELPTHSFDVCANGYGGSGRIILRKGDLVTKDITFQDVYKNRQACGMSEVYLSSPQTEIIGDEGVCVLLHDHAHDHDSCFDGIHLEIFMCPDGSSFDKFPGVMGWLKIISALRKLKEIGVLR